MAQPQIVTLSTKGQVVLPRALRLAAGLHSGARLSITLEPDGSMIVRPVRGKLDDFFHALDELPLGGRGSLTSAIMTTVDELDRATGQR